MRRSTPHNVGFRRALKTRRCICGTGKIYAETLLQTFRAFMSARITTICADSFGQELLEVGTRTIKREIAFLRDELNAPLIFDRQRRGYRYLNPGWNFPFIQMTEGEMLAFFIAEHALRHTGHTEAAQLKNTLAKLAAWLPTQIKVDLATLGENVKFQSLPFVILVGKLQSRQTSLNYQRTDRFGAIAHSKMIFA